MNATKQKNKKQDYKMLIMFTEKILLLIIGMTTLYLGLFGLATKSLPFIESIISLIFGVLVLLYLIKNRRIY
jgi:hypothetical protein